jgi:hypothetical protein
MKRAGGRSTTNTTHRPSAIRSLIVANLRILYAEKATLIIAALSIATTMFFSFNFQHLSARIIPLTSAKATGNRPYCTVFSILAHSRTNQKMQTTFFCSASAFATMLLMLVGLMIASNNLQYKGEQIASQMVPMPMVSRASGPWPKCVGMAGEECESYIESTTEGLTVVIVPEGSMVTEDFRTDRVRIWVDANDIVVATPSRG